AFWRVAGDGALSGAMAKKGQSSKFFPGDAPTPSTAASTPGPGGVWTSRKGDVGIKGKSRDEIERPGTSPPGARAAVQLPKRPNSMQTHARSLGDSGAMSSFGSTLGSTWGKSDVTPSPRGGATERQASKQDPSKPTVLPGGLGGTAQRLSQTGTTTAGGRNLDFLTKKIGSVIGSPGKLAGPKQKGSNSGGRTTQGELPASLALRAQNIEAKCSPDVRRAFRSKPVERCSCATITAVWSACDTFWEFDSAHSGEITREAYIDLMRECATVNTLRMLRRARLEFRFRRSAAPVTLEDFLAMVWPKATVEDRAKMLRWAELRECYDMIRHNFTATDQDLDKLFKLLSTRKPGEPPKVIASELSRSRVLARDVVIGFAKERHPKEVLFDFEEFKSIAWPKLKERWMTQDSFKKQKTVEEKDTPLRVRITRQNDSDQG
ncbi:unnamed protein product, partial [Symbiodinium pilosum]